MKRIISLICVFTLALSINIMPVNAQVTAKKSVYFTVEKLTIGQGLLVEPVKVDMEDGDTVAHIFGKVMAAKGMGYDAGDDISSFYLTNIKKADSGKIDIPKAIATMPDYIDTYNSKTYKAPTNENNDGKRKLYI